MMATESNGSEQLADQVQSALTISSSESLADSTTTKAPPTATTANIDAKHKKRLDKIVDGLVRKSTLTPKQQEELSAEAKYYLVVQSYSDMYEQNKRVVASGKETEGKLLNCMKQRDLLQAEYSKALTTQTKLESLCRELQRVNKEIKEDNLSRIRDEEEKRRETSSKFQLAIDDINQQVSTNSEKNKQLIQDNMEMSAKMKHLIEQYEAREEQIEKVLKHKDLENQLANAKFQQSELKLAEFVERTKSDRLTLETHCLELSKKCEFYQEAEKSLRAQLASYTDKYEEFQQTLKKSNEVFESFKAEIDKMSKRIRRLEQENSTLKGKWDGCEKSLQNVTMQKNELEDRCKKVQTKADMMEKLSRTLQTERNELKEMLKTYQQQQQSAVVEQTPAALQPDQTESVAPAPASEVVAPTPATEVASDQNDECPPVSNTDDVITNLPETQKEEEAKTVVEESTPTESAADAAVAVEVVTSVEIVEGAAEEEKQAPESAN